MQKQLLADTPLQYREGYLRDSCYKVYENESYTRRLEPEEVLERKTSLFERVRKIQTLSEELKEISKTFKDQIKELDNEKQILIQEIQFESTSERGNLYAMDDQDSGMMAFYDSAGTLVSSRPLKPEERQTSLLTIKKNGTDY
jgi:hypothetical protein